MIHCLYDSAITTAATATPQRKVLLCRELMRAIKAAVSMQALYQRESQEASRFVLYECSTRLQHMLSFLMHSVAEISVSCAAIQRHRYLAGMPCTVVNHILQRQGCSMGVQ
jgi:16S rRNA C1402 (ribose-2'-O) methylase RsmI